MILLLITINLEYTKTMSDIGDNAGENNGQA